MDRLVLPTAIVDFRREEVRGPDGTRIDLRPRAFAVLRCLAAHAERLVTKDDLLAECWPGVVVSEDSLTQCVSEIRHALGEGARDVVRTVPRRGYVLMSPEASVCTSEFAPPFVASSDFWPAIAVLPFDEFSDTQGPLGAGIAAEIITELARNRDLRVLSRHTSFGAAGQGLLPADISRKYRTRYVVEGSIRCMAGHVVVSVELIDGHDSRHIWADRFAASAGEAFAAQNGLIARIAARLFSEIRAAETIAALRNVPDDLSPHQLTLRAVAHWRGYNRSGFIKARAELERAVALDPNYALPRILLGGLNASDAGASISGELGPDALSPATTEIRRAIDVAQTSAHGHQSLGVALCFSGYWDEGLEVIERGAASRPGDTHILAFLGYAHMLVGRYESGLSHAKRAIALDPWAPPYFHGIAAYGLLALGRPDDALKHALVGTKQGRGHPASYLGAAYALSALGRAHEAAALITELLDRCPRFAVETPMVQVHFAHLPERRAHYLDHVRAAGLPERN